ncbi:hypothetical protein KAH94_00285, partial [bacterium]|nr:hypothetical protein [bacterium]
MKRMAQLTVFWIGCFALSIYGMKDITLLDNQCLLGSQNFKKSIKGASIKACYNFVADIIDGGQFSTEVKFKSILWWLPGKCKVSKLMVAGILESKEQVGNILQEVAVGKKK